MGIAPDGHLYVVYTRQTGPTGDVVIDWRESVARFEVVNEGRAVGTVALDVSIAPSPGHAGRVGRSEAPFGHAGGAGASSFAAVDGE